MWPLCAPAEVLLDDLAMDVHVGDIVAVIADRRGAMVVHRVQFIDGDRLILRGDTNDRADPPIPRAAIVGRLRAVRWGALVLPVPRSGPIGAAARTLGRAWARVAPTLRAGFARSRQAWANVDTR